MQGEQVEVSRAKNISSQSRLFFTFKAGRVFNKLKQAFVEALILNHIDPACHIQIETDNSCYVINGVFNQLTPDDLGR